MIIYELWEMCRNMMCKYESNCTFHINNVHHLTLRIDFGHKVHNVKRSFEKMTSANDNLTLKSINTRKNSCREEEIMVGERCRREPKDEDQKWHRRSKVWSILKKGEVTNFIERLHGFKPSVTWSMVKSWNEGIDKIDGVDFMVMEDVISAVTSIPIMGKKFYRDRKISGQAVVEFTKDLEEKKALLKKGTYYLSSTIKPLWRFVLRVIIKYISLDTRFDCLCTHHFVLLNYFRYGAKMSIPFYLYSSINRNINDYKEKHSSNPTLHEGLLLLIYAFFKAGSMGK